MVVGLAGGGVGVVQKRLAQRSLPPMVKGGAAAVLRHGDAAVEEQVAVEHLVQAALGVEEADVPLELLAALEGGGELVDEPVLLGRA